MGDMSREPSMEDILSSIRRVIARDEAPGRDTRARPADEDVLDLHQEEETAAVSAETARAGPAEELISAASADAARQSLEALTAAIAPAAAPAAANAAPASARTMEEVVVDALRPMLKQWLDDNLPPIVETMVAKEISRITSRKE